MIELRIAVSVRRPCELSYPKAIYLIQIETFRWRFDSPRLSLALRSLTSEQHAAHHIQQRISLSGDLDCKVLLADLRQGIIPNAYLANLRGIVGREMLEKIRAAALNRKKQHVDKVQEGQRGEDSNVRAGTADVLCA